MPPALPASLARLLSLLRPAFTAPSFDTFCWLVHGFIGRVGEHTITGVWQAARLAGVLHHSRAHGFFACRRWSADELGLKLAGFVVERFVGAQEPIRVAVDDTLFGRSGTKVFAVGWHHDSELKPGKRLRFGNVFVCLGLLVALPATGGRTVCLPLLFRLWRKSSEGEPQVTKVELAHELVALLAARLEGRRIELAADGLYANRSLRELPQNVSATVRMRSNAVLFGLAPGRTGKPGRPRKRGHRLGTPAQLAQDPGARWRSLQLRRRSGELQRVQFISLDCLWYGVLGELAVRVVLVRGRKRAGLDIAVVCTDPESSPAEILSRYSARWAIEVAFQDAKGQLGVGQAQNRTERAVRRTVPFGFLCQTLTILWYAANGDAPADVARRRRQAPWYRQKRHASFADMLVALRRELIRAEYRQQRHPRHSRQENPRPAFAPAPAGR
jgi:hypothetical protein